MSRYEADTTRVIQALFATANGGTDRRGDDVMAIVCEIVAVMVVGAHRTTGADVEDLIAIFERETRITIAQLLSAT